MKTFKIAKRYGAQLYDRGSSVCAKAATLALTGFAAAQANAAGIDDLFDAVDLSGISAKILALALLIVGIAMVMKGPSIVKRIISKI